MAPQKPPTKATTTATGPDPQAPPEPQDPPAAGLPPAAETTEPSTEDGPRTVLSDGDTAVIVDSPPLPGGVTGSGRRKCVVPGGNHMGGAVPGSLVCSYHTMHYDTAGKRRETRDSLLPDGTKGAKTA